MAGSTATRIRLRKGDTVAVLSGKDVGKQGEIVRVIPRQNKVIVRGINTAKKHQKPTRQTMQGGIIDKDMPMHVSNVALVCPDCGPTRIGYEIDAEGGKSRVCRKCGREL